MIIRRRGKPDQPGVTNDLQGGIHKQWADSDDPNRPESIEVSLLANGVVQETVTLSESSNWSYTWNDLDVLDSNDQLITYDIQEESLEGYSVEVTSNGYTFTITNTKLIYELPNTGGGGVIPFAVVGACFLLAAFATGGALQSRSREGAIYD